MQFRTEINVTPYAPKLQLDSLMVSIGSCFANTIGSKMAANKFNILVNPYGTIFNPISIFSLLQETKTDPSYFIQNQDKWCSYLHHSELNADSFDALECKIDQIIKKVLISLEATDHLIITLGTAWVYKLKHDNKVVANCHKMPRDLFEKHLLTVAEIQGAFHSLYSYLKSVNPKIKFIFTLSPVRHLKDTIELNAVGKSVLRLACYELTKKYQDVNYFPAFELMMDDLRDYRFYKADMIHPNDVAEDYIWQKWSENYFDAPTLDFIKEWNHIINALNHKPFDVHGVQYQEFARKYIEKLKVLSKMTDVTQELNYFKSRLK